VRNAGAATEWLVRAVNGAVVGLLGLPWLGDRVGRGMAVIAYTGRRSGRTFETPVSYRQSGGQVTIGVEFPDAKNWWRNFLGEGGPITIRLPGGDRTGHAVARRDTPRRATVTVILDAAGQPGLDGSTS
jgi:hypothetical protein